MNQLKINDKLYKEFMAFQDKLNQRRKLSHLPKAKPSLTLRWLIEIGNLSFKQHPIEEKKK